MLQRLKHASVTMVSMHNKLPSMPSWTFGAQRWKDLSCSVERHSSMWTAKPWSSHILSVTSILSFVVGVCLNTLCTANVHVFNLVRICFIVFSLEATARERENLFVHIKQSLPTRSNSCQARFLPKDRALGRISPTLLLFMREPPHLCILFLGIGRATTCRRGSQKSVQYPIDLGKNRVCIPEMVASLPLHQFMVAKCCWGMKTSLSSSWICVAERRTNSPIPFPETMRKSMESCVKTV